MATTYTCKERVVRNGRLVAFAGQTMSMAKAVSLGLAKPPNASSPRENAPDADAGVSEDKPAKTTARRTSARKKAESE